MTSILVTDSAAADRFSRELLPGEKIEWAGRPDPSVIFHTEDWFMVPFSLLWGGFAIFWFWGATGLGKIGKDPSAEFETFAAIWGGAFVLIGQYMIWGRFFYAWWRKKRTVYALTNRRVLIFVQGLTGLSQSSAYFNQMPMIDYRVRADGIGSISFGGPLQGQLQARGAPPRPPTFEDVNDAEAMYRLALRIQDDARKPAL
jgi:hypothetical protein